MYPYYKYLRKERYCKDVPIAFPPQHQSEHPGLEYVMNPRPISENPYYKGSGKLERKTALITGGDSGIGRAVAYSFAKEGANVAIVYLYEHEDAEETKERIEKLGVKCLLICGNLTHEDMSVAAVRQCLDEFGKIDILVNNHAVQFVQKRIEDITEEQLDLTFRTNIYSYFFMVKAVLPHLQRGSSIINTASVTAYNGHPKLLDYSATKGAVVTFTRSLSLSLIKKGIRVNGVAPGPIWTPLIPSSFSAEEVKTFGTLTPEVPMKRAGQPFEIAPSYVFLASDDSSYMSGQILHPNGGDMVSS
ncbi:SDR family oxidoreductase [Pradoshia sp. D12]|uniref:SDR family oxidoreductase n=1 Tax=Bacillaceae TaxID=186817 RepID=UPI00080AD00E|nr:MULTISPECIES: SDR family oxidoreductase [Bacillaceae]OCA84778.1 NAD(P)-dependent oxidoreductase [Bacillus sp. FJAT-27986]QFK72756.1 SDR family oxidoreductase [Pradoshia sp. D12]TPF71750.1 SDR family oxidoreductase [Bacillus sp. D12]